jgi:hypothetical protein
VAIAELLLPIPSDWVMRFQDSPMIYFNATKAPETVPSRHGYDFKLAIKQL